jgi:hypothetical protein
MSEKCIRKKNFEEVAISRKRITKEYNLAKKTAGWGGVGGGGGYYPRKLTRGLSHDMRN